jgi:CheY-like chemotaxis protein
MRATKSPAPSRGGRAVKRTVRKPVARKTNAVEAALAAFAHDIRTPLTGILALGELLASSDLGPRERAWAQAVKSSAEYLAQLATLAVDAAKANTNGLVLRRETFRPGRLVDGIAASLAARAETRGLTSEVRVKGVLPDIVIGDVLRLRAALENLIDNAVKFTESGGVALSATQVRGSNGKAGISFAVSDSGIGLTLKEIEKLFRPFSQANVSIASRFGGAGLGLSSVKQLARAMGGDIAVAQRKGGGTTFTLMVTLALARAAKASPADVDAAPEAVTALRLLSVEDNPFGRVVLNAILTELGHQAEFIGQGAAAAERVVQGAFDAVLMDMVLPDISGIEAIRRIRALQGPAGRIAIIGVSGRSDDEAASRAAGADAFLVKPVSPRALATALLAATRPSAAAT